MIYVQAPLYYIISFVHVVSGSIVMHGVWNHWSMRWRMIEWLGPRSIFGWLASFHTWCKTRCYFIGRATCKQAFSRHYRGIVKESADSLPNLVWPTKHCKPAIKIRHFALQKPQSITAHRALVIQNTELPWQPQRDRSGKLFVILKILNDTYYLS